MAAAMDPRAPRSAQTLHGLPVDMEVMFTSHKGARKKRIEKRQTDLVGRLGFLKPFLSANETILLVTTGCSPTSLAEQLMTGWAVYYIKRSLLVVTDRRIFHIPTRMDYSYRSSIAEMPYAGLRGMKVKGRALCAEYSDGGKERFLHIGRGERKKLRAILEKTPFSGAHAHGSMTRPGQRQHLCPRCRNALDAGNYVCPTCRLAFKDRAGAMKYSLIFPGGGYFYTGHPLMGVLDALVESLLLVSLAVSLAGALKGGRDGLEGLVVFGVALAIEKAVSVYHANHFIKEFIPAEKDVKPYGPTTESRAG
jgi:hypothetical protein